MISLLNQLPIPLPAASIWLISAATVGCVLGRPRDLPEAVWAALGAVLLVGCGLLPWREALGAVARGTDVYLFLTGMMLLSELARREGVFDWCAALAVGAARRSPVRLFWLIYAVGVVVTVFLSNDATAVVMTPAVFAATKAAKVEKPLPYLFACAMVANAASFVLPISNPANLVVFGGHMPPLAEWLRRFALPSVLAIAATGLALFLVTRKALRGEVGAPTRPATLSASGRLALGGIALAAVALLAASALRVDLGGPTLGAAAAALGLVMLRDPKALWQTPRKVSWSVLPLVAGLFVVVEGLNHAGALRAGQEALQALARLPVWAANLAGAFGITAISNVINNLPAGLITGTAVHRLPVADSLRNALLIGVDLGPNLSVTGSLATVLWLIVLRREGQQVSAWSFLKVGVIVAPIALVLAVLASTWRW
ncbi:MAG TPA: arsenic transporter [Chthoniobacterales bacterium]